MDNTYTWVIEQLDCVPSIDGQSNVVSNVHWRVKVAKDTHEVAVYGAQELTFDSKNAFISYVDLTKDTVVGWVQEAMGIDAVTKLQETLDAKLDTLANPPIVTPPLPWA